MWPRIIPIVCLVVLCVHTAGRPAGAAPSHAIFPLPPSDTVPYTERAIGRCAEAGMRLATQRSLSVAISAEKVVRQCGPDGAPVLLASQFIHCKDVGTFFFWSPRLDILHQAMGHGRSYCKRAAATKDDKSCAVEESKFGELFYRLDDAAALPYNCTGDISMDYNPASRYTVARPGSGNVGFVALVASRSDNGDTSVNWGSLELIGGEPNYALMGRAAVLVQYVLCEADGSPNVTGTECYTGSSGTSVLPDPAGADGKAVAVTVGAILAVLLLLLVSLVLVIYLCRRRNSKKGRRPPTTHRSYSGLMGGESRKNSFAPALSRHGSINGNPMERFQSFRSGNPMERQQSFRSGNPMERQQSFRSGNPMERQQSFRSGNPMERQQSFRSGNPMERQQSFGGGNPMERQQSFRSGNPMERQQSFRSGNPMERQQSFRSGNPMERRQMSFSRAGSSQNADVNGSEFGPFVSMSGGSFRR
ncbi:hypothetical protein ERJ75_000830900 [Trypanosoma vivax]|nr:hypothetical protein ERJ75_000830900 [Trypanosoma vivax]